MTTPAFPSGLPNPTYAGHGLDPIDQTIRTNMEVGAARTRRRTVNRQDKTTLSWLFKDSDMTTFRAWFDNASTGAAGGSAWFTINLPTGIGGLTSATARFIGTFKAGMLDGMYWSVTATLEIRSA